MKKLRAFLFLGLLLIPFVALHALQQTPTPAPRVEITGVNASQMPTVTITSNVYDNLGQPVLGLNAAAFALTGELAGKAQISKVENVTDNNLPFAVVLAIDISGSMTGSPIDNAKLAAHAFVSAIGPNDPVAILTFGSRIKVLQAYTSDKDTLNQAIDSIEAGGQTALYQGSYEAIDLAATSPTPRHAVILLSDGAEYGGISKVNREAASQEAIVRGVPVYTIGLGFGIDRSYLEELSTSTNAHFNDLPNSTQLTQIYTDLAAQLRSQYVLTLNAPLPLDGTQYTLGLEVTTPQGTADTTATLRTPIPVPIVKLPTLSGALTEPTDVTATILHDDPLSSVTFQADAQAPVAASTEPYTFTITPAAFTPGDHTLNVTATDANGDIGKATLNFSVGALPSQIALSPDLASLNEIATPQSVMVQTSGQTPINNATIAFDGGTSATLSAPYNFILDPNSFTPGDHSVVVTVTNTGGVTSSQSFPFKVAPLPPQISITGLEAGQTLSTPTTITVQATSQEPISQLNVSVNEISVPPAQEEGTYVLDPIMFAPGKSTLTVTAIDVGQRSGSQTINFVVAPLPPKISASGLTPGETIHEDRDVTLSFVSQAAVIHVAVFVDGVDLAHEVKPPYGVTLKVLDYAPGAHTLRFIADDADGQESTLDIPFSIAPEPAATATQAAFATATQVAQATATQIAQVSQTALAVQAAQAAQASATAVAQANATSAQTTRIAQVNATATEVKIAQTATQNVLDATSTQGAANATAVQNAINTTATQVKIEASATQAAQATNAAAAIQSTQITQATATQAAQSTQAGATDAARATQLANNLATLQSEMTATAQSVTASALNAQATATQQANASATQAPLNQTATRAAQSTQASAVDAARATQLANNLATLQSEMTATAQSVTATALSAQATATQQANASATQAPLNQTATRAAQSTQASLDDAARATQLANNLATLQSEMTATAQSVTATALSAQATATQQAITQATAQSAQATATQQANINATRSAQATATQSAQATLRAQAAAQMQAATRDALATANAQARLEAQATRSVLATAQANSNAQATQASANATATQIVQATKASANATATQIVQGTQVAFAATATQASVTQAAQQTLSALAATATQLVINGTATRQALETEAVIEATATQVAAEMTATNVAMQTGTVQANLNAAATVTQAAQLTLAAARDATTTAEVNGTLAANIVATDNAAASATLLAQSTNNIRLTAIGPTATPVNGGAQGAATVTIQPSPTLTEIQAQQPPASSNVAPIAIVLIVIVVIILVLVLVLRRPPPSTPR